MNRETDDERLLLRMSAFLRGELTPEEAKQLRAELEHNEAMSSKLELLMFGQPLQQEHEGLEEMERGELSEEQQLRIIRRGKRKSVFSQAMLTVSTLVVLGVLLLMFSYSNMFFSSWWFGPKTEDILRVTADVIHFTKPGVTVGNTHGSTRFLSSQTFAYDLQERVGRSFQHVGSYEERFVFSKMSSKFAWNNGQHRLSFFFHYPATPDPDPGWKMNKEAWSTLQKLPEGTVAQMAVSFDKLLSHDEYFAIVKKYDLSTVWLAVDTGVESGIAKRNPLLGSGIAFGYAPDSMQYGSTGSRGSFTIAVNGEGDRRAKAFVDEVNYLAAHDRLTNKLLENNGIDPFVRGITIEQRAKFLTENGVKLYGAIVTGPTRELLKLQDEQQLIAPVVGRIDWWNWDQQSSGTEYSY